MTAKVQPDEVDAFKALGALDVIAKPFQGTPVDYSWDLQALSHRPYKSAGNIIWQH